MLGRSQILCKKFDRTLRRGELGEPPGPRAGERGRTESQEGLVERSSKSCRRQSADIAVGDPGSVGRSRSVSSLWWPGSLPREPSCPSSITALLHSRAADGSLERRGAAPHVSGTDRATEPNACSGIATEPGSRKRMQQAWHQGWPGERPACNSGRNCAYGLRLVRRGELGPRLGYRLIRQPRAIRRRSRWYGELYQPLHLHLWHCVRRSLLGGSRSQWRTRRRCLRRPDSMDSIRRSWRTGDDRPTR